MLEIWLDGALDGASDKVCLCQRLPRISTSLRFYLKPFLTKTFFQEKPAKHIPVFFYLNGPKTVCLVKETFKADDHFIYSTFEKR